MAPRSSCGCGIVDARKRPRASIIDREAVTTPHAVRHRSRRMNSLAQRLRSQTWPAHRQVESTGFVRALLGGHLDRPRYCLLLASLHPIYAALERALRRHAGHAALAAACAPTLQREEALAQDLAHLHGEDWRDTLPPQPAALDYARSSRMTRPGRARAAAGARLRSLPRRPERRPGAAPRGVALARPGRRRGHALLRLRQRRDHCSAGAGLPRRARPDRARRADRRGDRRGGSGRLRPPPAPVRGTGTRLRHRRARRRHATDPVNPS